jgi:hypothetical protein
MAIVSRVFRYPDGREERAEPFDAGHEQYGVGETCERDGIPWKAIEAHVPDPIGHPNRVEVIFVRND